MKLIFVIMCSMLMSQGAFALMEQDSKCKVSQDGKVYDLTLFYDLDTCKANALFAGPDGNDALFNGGKIKSFSSWVFKETDSTIKITFNDITDTTKSGTLEMITIYGTLTQPISCDLGRTARDLKCLKQK